MESILTFNYTKDHIINLLKTLHLIHFRENDFGEYSMRLN